MQEIFNRARRYKEQLNNTINEMKNILDGINRINETGE